MHITFQASDRAATTAPATTTQPACSPHGPLIIRSHRPVNLPLRGTNGLTTVAIHELKQSIRAASRTASCAPKPQLARPNPPRRRPKTPIVMGNKPSSVDGSDDLGADKESLRSVVRKPVRAAVRKSSTNLFKRVDSKSPLPRSATAASNVVRPTPDEESPVDSPESVVVTGPKSVSTVTTITTDENVKHRLSASTTIKGSRSTSDSEGQSEDQYEKISNDAGSDFDAPPAVPAHRASALSPTIPAPSFLPEDSPHKYGLKDRMDTPELSDEPAEEINVNKARRRSNGLEIFQVSSLHKPRNIKQPSH